MQEVAPEEKKEDTGKQGFGGDKYQSHSKAYCCFVGFSFALQSFDRYLLIPECSRECSLVCTTKW